MIMKSLALWYEKSGNGQDDNQNLELHINFWKLPSSNTFKRFLDFGFKIEHPEFIKKIFVFLPISINKDELVDVGKIIADHKSLLLTAIFNEDYKITFEENTPYLEIKDAKDKCQFWLTLLRKISSSKNNRKYTEPIFYVSKEEYGSIITIELPEYIDRSPIYFRIRIASDSLISLSHIFIPNDSLFYSALKKVELFDFRINSKRHLPASVLNKITESNLFNLTKINFFFICDSNEDILLTQKQFIRTRVLESNLWDKYLNFSLQKKHQLLAYQWKLLNKDHSIIADFSLLIKSQFKHYNWINIGKYLLVLFLVGLLLNLTSSFLYDKIKNNSAPFESNSTNSSKITTLDKKNDKN